MPRLQIQQWCYFPDDYWPTVIADDILDIATPFVRAREYTTSDGRDVEDSREVVVVAQAGIFSV